jgi:hypothetical protein
LVFLASAGFLFVTGYLWLRKSSLTHFESQETVEKFDGWHGIGRMIMPRLDVRFVRVRRSRRIAKLALALATLSAGISGALTAASLGLF